MKKPIEQNKPGKSATCGASFSLKTTQRRVVKRLQAYYKQGGKWYKVGPIFGQGRLDQ